MTCRIEDARRIQRRPVQTMPREADARSVSAGIVPVEYDPRGVLNVAPAHRQGRSLVRRLLIPGRRAIIGVANGKVNVVYGAHDINMDIAGFTVEEIQGGLRDVLNLAAGCRGLRRRLACAQRL